MITLRRNVAVLLCRSRTTLDDDSFALAGHFLGAYIDHRFDFRQHSRNCEATINRQSGRQSKEASKAHSLFRQRDRRLRLNASMKLESQYGCGTLKLPHYEEMCRRLDGPLHPALHARE